VRAMTEVRLTAAVLAALADGAARAYPHEGCGALLGPATGLVTRELPVPNREAGTPRVRFEIAPLDYLAVEDEAERLGLRLLGFWHSHPDDVARPSATDRAYAWEGLLTVIVAVPAREPREIGAWEIVDTEAPFAAVRILEHETGRPVTDVRPVAV